MQFNPNTSHYSTAVGAWIGDNFEQQFTRQNALLARLHTGKGFKTGSAYLVQPVSQAANPTVAGVSNFTAPMSIPADQGLSAIYTWSWYQGLTAINKQEEAAINTEYEMVDLLQSRLEDTIASFAQLIGQDLYSATNASLGKIAGIPYAVDDANVVFGTIDRTSAPWWKSVVQNAVGTLTLQKMNSIYNQLQASTGHAPNIIVMPPDLYGAFESLILASQRFTQDYRMAEYGYTAYLFKGATVLFDSLCPAGTVFYLNDQDIFLVSATREPTSDPVEFPDRLVKGYKHSFAVALVAKRCNSLGRQNGVTV